MLACFLASGCFFYESPERVYSPDPPPAGVVFVSPNLYYSETVAGRIVVRRYYVWHPSRGWYHHHTHELRR